MAGREEDNEKEGRLRWLTPWASLALLILATGIVLNGDAYDREADRLEMHSLQTVDAELRGNLSALRQEEELGESIKWRPHTTPSENPYKEFSPSVEYIDSLNK